MNTAKTLQSKPVMRYHGGKWRLAPWITEYFPPHSTYVEPYGGGASVLLLKERCHSEVYNDIDGQVNNLMRVLRERGTELAMMVALTPFSREEFELSRFECDDELEQARRTLVRSWLGHSGGTWANPTGFRSDTKRAYSLPCDDWCYLPPELRIASERLRGVCIERQNAVDVIKRYDHEATLFYVDPPYVLQRRKLNSRKGIYGHEMDKDAHRLLAITLREAKGMVVLSGNNSAMYSVELFPGWMMVQKQGFGDSKEKSTECLYLNPACQQALLDTAAQKSLFG